MAREGHVFKTTAGNEVYRSHEDTMKAVRQWLTQNGVENVTDELCNEHVEEFVKRFKVVEETPA